MEGHLYLLLTGDVPTAEEAAGLRRGAQGALRGAEVRLRPAARLPVDSHPMAMFSAAIVAMQRESFFVKRYHEGLGKMDYWEPTLEDALNLLARLPEIGAFIYRLKYRDGDIIAPDPEPRSGRQLRAHDGCRQAVRRPVAPLLHPAQRPRERQRQRPHRAPGRVGAVRRLLRHLGHDQRPGRSAARPGQRDGPALDPGRHGQDGRQGPDRRRDEEVRLGHAEQRTGRAGLRPRGAAQDRSALHGAARVLPEVPARRPDLQVRRRPLPGDAADPGEAGQGEEPLAERRRAVRRHPVVLRRPGVRRSTRCSSASAAPWASAATSCGTVLSATRSSARSR